MGQSNSASYRIILGAVAWRRPLFVIFGLIGGFPAMQQEPLQAQLYCSALGCLAVHDMRGSQGWMASIDNLTSSWSFL